MTDDVLSLRDFSEINVDDNFFDDLKARYSGFEDWFERKSLLGEKAYTVFEGSKIIAFMYLKKEFGEDKGIVPDISKYEKRMKVGTFKVEAHGTILGNRLMALLLHKFIEQKYDACYVTMYDSLGYLQRLFEKYGFRKFGKRVDTGEVVLIRDKTVLGSNSLNYPRFNLSGSKYLIGIYPKFHTRLFPDSRLKTESKFQTEDVSETNSIEKTYLTNMSQAAELKIGDKLVIYRTAETQPAEWSAVATSICTVTECKDISRFSSLDEFVSFVTKQSIFSDEELRTLWVNRRYPTIIKFQYNVAFPHRIVRHDLIEKCGIDRNEYAGFMSLSEETFKKVLAEGQVDESYVID